MKDKNKQDKYMRDLWIEMSKSIPPEFRPDDRIYMSEGVWLCKDGTFYHERNEDEKD